MTDAALGLREEYPTWCKDRLVVLMGSEGRNCSRSTVAKILRKQREGDMLEELLTIKSHLGEEKAGTTSLGHSSAWHREVLGK